MKCKYLHLVPFALLLHGTSAGAKNHHSYGLCQPVEKTVNRSDCDVQVRCDTHTISILGQVSKIDCGKPGHVTHDGIGKIGRYHCGHIVPNGIRIEGIPGMGDDGGGKVFHSVSWGPKGLNDSRGCIHVTPAVRTLLHRCAGSKLTITGADQGTHAHHQNHGNGDAID